MSETTGIEWTDSTWNPLRGCSRVSEGCRHCYAEKVAWRFSGAGQPYEGLAVLRNGHASWTGNVMLVEKHLLDPLKWKSVSVSAAGDWIHRPRRIFVNSMSDLFHENVPDDWIDRIFAVMALCPQHIFQVLTKRPERMLAYLNDAPGRLADVIESMRFDEPRRAVGPLPHLNGGETWFPLANVWLGVSVENQTAADERIPLLLQTPAAVRFISAEPLLGPINLHPWLCVDGNVHRPEQQWTDRYWEPSGKLDWVICGGESGAEARPMHLDWALSLRDQCRGARVPFFFKQWGEWAPTTDPAIARARGVAFEGCMSRVGKKAAGAELEGCEWREFPAVSA